MRNLPSARIRPGSLLRDYGTGPRTFLAVGVFDPVPVEAVARSFAPTPEPDARYCRYRVSGILASMSSYEPKRISGTYWERFLMNAIPVPVLIVLFIGLKNSFASLSLIEAALIIAFGSLLIWIIDSEPARRKNPVSLFDGTALQLGDERVPSNAIHSITPLQVYKGWTRLVQIEYHCDQGFKTAIILSKPAPFWMMWAPPRTLRLLLKSHPELANRVQIERTT